NDIMGDFDRLEFNDARIYFNNGDIIDVDLGRIILHTVDEFGDYIETSSASSSSDGTSSSTNTLKEDIKLIQLESPLFKEAKNLYKIQIDGKDYEDIFGIQYNKGDILRIESSFRTPENILDKYSQFDLQPRLYFEDSNGEKSYINV